MGLYMGRRSGETQLKRRWGNVSVPRQSGAIPQALMMKVVSTALLALTALIFAAHQVSAKERGARVTKSGPAVEKSQKEANSGKSDAAGPSQAEQPSNTGSENQKANSTDKAGSASTPPLTWTEEEIREAKAHCDKVLRGIEAVIEAADPIKEGQCGAPAPVRLVSIGRNPEVAFSPPVTVTCDLVASLAKWIKEDLQPLAKEHLDGPIVKIGTMSSYSCRNAYGRKTTRLSEHALANAVDIGSFTTKSGLEVNLLTGWGLTARDVQAIVARAKAEEEAKRAAAAASSKSAGNSASEAVSKNGDRQAANIMMASAIPLSVRKSIPLPVRKTVPLPIRKTVALATAPAVKREAKGQKAPRDKRKEVPVLRTASHLGGPGSTSNMKALEAQPDNRAARFLRAIHGAACRHFGTVLGPEANEAHRNHFHLDMAKRRNSNYCE